MLVIILKSIIIGALVGMGIAGGAARMFHAPNVQGMGAFRTLGEMNACDGDPTAHFSFGLGLYFSSAAAVIGTGSMSSDVLHRIVPNWSAALAVRQAKDKSAMTKPFNMMAAGAAIGALVVTTLNTMAGLIPKELAAIAENIVSPAASLILNPVLPVVFWISALDSGKITGISATILGGFAQVIMGNATPGCVLGIIIGQSIEESGMSRMSIFLIAFVTIMFLLIAFFRGKLAFLGLSL